MMGRDPPRHDRAQRPGEQHLTRAQWDALMRRRAARLAQGQASDKDTDMSEEDKDTDDPPDPKVPAELQERLSTTAMFQLTLLFSQRAATALYDDQAVQNLDTLREIDDDMTKESVIRLGEAHVAHLPRC